MGAFIFLLIVFLGICYLLVSFIKWLFTGNTQAQNEAALRRQEQEDHELIKKTKVLRQMMEVKRQARIVGDTTAADAVDNMTYQGQLPELRDDGAYMSLYDNLRIFKIAGINRHGDLTGYVGEFRGVLVPEPTNDYDPFAIMVKCDDGKMLGYIKEEHTRIVRWMIGAEQPLGEEMPTTFKPYRITGFIEKKTDESDMHTFYDGTVYIVKRAEQ